MDASRNDDRFHTVVAGDRVDLFAASYLGQADLRWVLLDQGNPTLPKPTFDPINRLTENR